MENDRRRAAPSLHGLHVVAIIFALFFSVSGLIRWGKQNAVSPVISVGAFSADIRTAETELATNAMKYLDEQAPKLEQVFGFMADVRPTIRFFGRYNFDGPSWAHYHVDTDTICINLNAPELWMPNSGGNVGMTLVHEYVHFLIDQRATRAGRGRAPRWLSDGLAGYYAREWSGTLGADTLVSIDELAKADNPLLYEESFMLVRYMVETYGEDKVLALIDAYGKGVKAPLEAVLRTDEDELLQRLRASLPR